MTQRSYFKVLVLFGFFVFLNPLLLLAKTPDTEKMIELSVNITEINSKDLKELGVKWFNHMTIGEGAYSYNIVPESGLSGGETLQQVLAPQDINSLPALIGVADIRRLSGFWMDIKMLAEKGKANIIATPKLTSYSGRKSSLLIGGEFPIVAQTMTGVSIEYKKFGTILEVGSVVYTDNTIDISLTVERSSLSETTVGDYPVLEKRNISLSINMNNGETLTIGGLNEKKTTKASEGVPFLMDIPILGYLFKWEKNVTEDINIIIMITPKIIERL